MRKGFTTGSCAAAAAKAAAIMLFTGVKKEEIAIMTPAGIEYRPKVQIIEMSEDTVCCGIIKDGGDDPDSTDGALICARVSLETDDETKKRKAPDSPSIRITGGTGVGKVTRKGLDQPVGEYAINSVPRSMITKEVTEVMKAFDYSRNLDVEISVPDGEVIAKKTFNPHMGIEGGISILGTSGIVEPMSTEAVIKTIELDLRMKREEGNEAAIMVPGNYGANFLKNTYGIDPDRAVHFSNYIGKAIDLAIEVGFRKVLIAGHTGKMVKVSGGIMNTHSSEADARMELMAAAAIRGAEMIGMTIDMSFLQMLLSQATTSACLDLISEKSPELLKATCQAMLERVMYHLNRRAGGRLEIDCLLYENSYGLLAATEGAERKI